MDDDPISIKKEKNQESEKQIWKTRVGMKRGSWGTKVTFRKDCHGLALNVDAGPDLLGRIFVVQLGLSCERDEGLWAGRNG